MRPAGGIALAAVLAIVAAGCGGGSKPATQLTIRVAIHRFHGCRLSAKQHRLIAAAKREIALMHRLEQPLKTVRPTGPMKLELAVNRFLLDVGPLPPDVKGRLMNKAKAASALCEDCFNAIEAMEPAVQTRLGGGHCAPR